MSRRTLHMETLEDRRVLATFVVQSAVDSSNPGSLRWAIDESNRSAGSDTIEFAPELAGTPVVLTRGQLFINDNVTINGNGADTTFISGNDTSRIFLVDDGSSTINRRVNLSDLTLRDGLALTADTIHAFSYVARSATISGNSAVLDHPLLNRNPNAVFTVTPNNNPGGRASATNAKAIGVWYDAGSGLWNIFNQDVSNLAATSAFNVLLPHGSDQAFVHTSTAGSIRGNYTELNHPQLNGRPDALFHITPNWNPGGTGGTYDNHHAGVFYSTLTSRWNIFHQDLTAMTAGSSYNVIIPGPTSSTAAAIVHTVTAGNRNANVSTIDIPLINNRPDVVLQVTQNWNPPGSSGVYNNQPIAIQYHLPSGKYQIINTSGASLPLGAAFNVSVASVGGDGGALSTRENTNLARVRVELNTASYSGGGIATMGGGFSAFQSTIRDNSSAGTGGGLHNSDDTLSIWSSTISSNRSGIGAGIYSNTALDASSYLWQTTISGNMADAQGGGVYKALGNLAINQSTVTANHAPSGAGVASAANGRSAIWGRAIVEQSIIAGNHGPDVDSVEFFTGDVQVSFESESYNVIGTGNSTSAFLPTDQVNVLDPLLAPLNDYGGPTLTHALLFGSPAVNGGDPTYDHVPDSDARSDDDFVSPRSLLGRVDVGAVEHVLAPAQFVVDSTDDLFDADFGPGQLTLREAIVLSNYFPGIDHIAFSPSLGGATILLAEGQLVVTDSVDIRGPDGASVVIDAGQHSRVFLIDDRTSGTIDVRMEGLTIQGGDAHDNPAVGAFVHTATPDTIDGTVSELDSPLLNDNVDALFHITHNFNPSSSAGTYFDAPSSIYFDGTRGRWNIFQPFHGPFQTGASFNVYVPKGDDLAYLHRVTSDNRGSNYTVLDHPSLNGNPSATLLVSHLANTSGGIGGQEIFGVWYNTTTSRWYIYNQDLSSIPVEWNFAVIVPADTPDNTRFVHHVTATNVNSNWTVIDNPATNNNPNAIVHVTPIYSKHYVGVWYDGVTGRWNIYNEDLAAMDMGDAFHVYVDHAGVPDARGGAILSRENLSIDSTVVRNNTGSSGGAIYQQEARLEIAESWIQGNEASEGHGGGIVVYRSNVEINRSTISDNLAEGNGAVGGGIYIDNHPDLVTNSTVILNSTISLNRAATHGGGIYHANGFTSVRSSTIADNQAGLNVGSGLFSFSGPTVRTQLTHTIVADNPGTDIAVGPGASPSIESVGYNVIGEHSGPFVQQPTDIANVANAGLLPLSDNGGPTPTHALRRTSPAFNGGTMNAAVLPATDQRGENRLALGRADVGAYERQTAPLAGDFDDDGRYTCDDIDTLMAGIATGGASTLLDMNLDGRLDLADRDAWLSHAGNANLGPGRSYLPGDANLDGVVDGTDLAIWNAHRFTSDTRWCHGNFNGDTVVDVSDFSLWLQHRFTAPTPAAAVPSGRSRFAPLAAAIARRQR